jgi:hypothetical protein
MSGISTAHSVVEPSPSSKGAGFLVILYAVITMVPGLIFA